MKIKRKARADKSKRAGDYIDNVKFLSEITAYRTAYMANKANPETTKEPRISEYIGWCFLKIAEGQAKNRNFYNYPYRDEMISDGYFDCVKYAYVFNPEKTNNPFAYFSQVCYYAFIRKIGKEKKHYYTLCKAIENSEIFGQLNDLQGHDEGDLAIIEDIGYSKEAKNNMFKFIASYEEAKETKNEKRNAAARAGDVPDQDDEQRDES